MAFITPTATRVKRGVLLYDYPVNLTIYVQVLVTSGFHYDYGPEESRVEIIYSWEKEHWPVYKKEF